MALEVAKEEGANPQNAYEAVARERNMIATCRTY